MVKVGELGGGRLGPLPPYACMQRLEQQPRLLPHEWVKRRKVALPDRRLDAHAVELVRALLEP